MTDSINTTGRASLSETLAAINLGPTNSIQFMFAKLQLAQAQICKNSATEYMDQIKAVQKEQEEVADMISRARALQNEAKTSKKSTEMPEDMVEFFNKHNIKFDGQSSDNFHNNDEWTFNIEGLSNYQETLSNQTQTLMVYLQDFISQSNSLIQGANSAIREGSQVLQSIVTGR